MKLFQTDILFAQSYVTTKISYEFKTENHYPFNKHKQDYFKIKFI